MEFDIKKHTILEIITGSNAYGLNTKDSDLDMKGIAIPPKEYFLGFNKIFYQHESREPIDIVIYDIRKFFKLAKDCNPSIIEMLWVDPEHIKIKSIYSYKIIENRDKFLSKKAKFTFSGYGMAQLKRIKTHRSWLLNPIEEKPSRVDFKLPEASLLSPDIRGAIHSLETKGVDVNKQFSSNVMEIYKAEREYHNKLQGYNQYQEWKKSRNPARAKMEKEFGYDCYLESETEFLTNNGWKKFDDIHIDHLGTINKEGVFEWELPISSVDKTYSGKIYNFEYYGGSFAVTENHNLFISDVHRNSKNNFSTQYDKNNSNWRLESVNDLIHSNRSHYHVYANPYPIRQADNMDRDYLLLIGMFLSDGTINFRGKIQKTETVKCLRLTQQPKNKDFCKIADRLAKRFNGRRYPYKKEVAWTFPVDIAREIYNWCGHSEDKHLPGFWRYLGPVHIESLWHGLMLGDGSENSIKKVYYTSLKRLADEIQAMLIMAGKHVVVYGPYKYKDQARYGNCPMYQVVVGKRMPQMRMLKLTKNCSYRDVKNERVVCFEVPNGIIITRRKGKPAIQGNCKHAMHLVRLMRMCEEILSTGEVIVKRPDREELLSIRNGAWKYDDLIQWAEDQDKKMNSLYETSKLPHSPDVNFLDNLCIDIVEEYISFPNET